MVYIDPQWENLDCPQWVDFLSDEFAEDLRRRQGSGAGHSTPTSCRRFFREGAKDEKYAARSDRNVRVPRLPVDSSPSPSTATACGQDASTEESLTAASSPLDPIAGMSAAPVSGTLAPMPLAYPPPVGSSSPPPSAACNDVSSEPMKAGEAPRPVDHIELPAGLCPTPLTPRLMADASVSPAVTKPCQDGATPATGSDFDVADLSRRPYPPGSRPRSPLRHLQKCETARPDTGLAAVQMNHNLMYRLEVSPGMDSAEVRHKVLHGFGEPSPGLDTPPGSKRHPESKLASLGPGSSSSASSPSTWTVAKKIQRHETLVVTSSSCRPAGHIAMYASSPAAGLKSLGNDQRAVSASMPASKRQGTEHKTIISNSNVQGSWKKSLRPHSAQSGSFKPGCGNTAGFARLAQPKKPQGLSTEDIQLEIAEQRRKQAALERNRGMQRWARIRQQGPFAENDNLLGATEAADFMRVAPGKGRPVNSTALAGPGAARKRLPAACAVEAGGSSKPTSLCQGVVATEAMGPTRPAVQLKKSTLPGQLAVGSPKLQGAPGSLSCQQEKEEIGSIADNIAEPAALAQLCATQVAFAAADTRLPYFPAELSGAGMAGISCGHPASVNFVSCPPIKEGEADVHGLPLSAHSEPERVAAGETVQPPVLRGCILHDSASVLSPAQQSISLRTSTLRDRAGIQDISAPSPHTACSEGRSSMGRTISLGQQSNISERSSSRLPGMRRSLKAIAHGLGKVAHGVTNTMSRLGNSTRQRTHSVPVARVVSAAHVVAQQPVTEPGPVLASVERQSLVPKLHLRPASAESAKMGCDTHAGNSVACQIWEPVAQQGSACVAADPVVPTSLLPRLDQPLLAVAPLEHPSNQITKKAHTNSRPATSRARPESARRRPQSATMSSVDMQLAKAQKEKAELEDLRRKNAAFATKLRSLSRSAPFKGNEQKRSMLASAPHKKTSPGPPTESQQGHKAAGRSPPPVTVAERIAYYQRQLRTGGPHPPTKLLVPTELKPFSLVAEKRIRPQRYKSKKEIEAEEMLAMPHFQARPVPRRIFASQSPIATRFRARSSEPQHHRDRADKRKVEDRSRSRSIRPLTQRQRSGSASRLRTQGPGRRIFVARRTSRKAPAGPDLLPKPSAKPPTRPVDVPLATAMRCSRRCDSIASNPPDAEPFCFKAAMAPRTTHRPSIPAKPPPRPPVHPRPPSLATESVGRSRRLQLEEAVDAERAAQDSAHLFKAAPTLPASLAKPLFVPKLPSALGRGAIKPKPLHLASLARSKLARDRFQEQRHQEERLEMLAREFRALKLRKITPFAPEPCSTLPTIPESPRFQLKARLLAYSEAQLAWNRRQTERAEAQAQADRERAARLQAEWDMFRKQHEFKAAPMPDFSIASVSDVSDGAHVPKGSDSVVDEP